MAQRTHAVFPKRTREPPTQFALASARRLQGHDSARLRSGLKSASCRRLMPKSLHSPGWHVKTRI
jgi:hypothetical protein